MHEAPINDVTFLRQAEAPTLPPPTAVGGVLGALRKHLFSGWVSGPLALLFVAALVWVVPDLIRFYVIDAVWTASDGAACRVQGTGALPPRRSGQSERKGVKDAEAMRRFCEQVRKADARIAAQSI